MQSTARQLPLQLPCQLRRFQQVQLLRRILQVRQLAVNFQGGLNVVDLDGVDLELALLELRAQPRTSITRSVSK